MPRLTIKGLQDELIGRDLRIAKLERQLGDATAKAQKNEMLARAVDEVIRRNRFESDRYASLHREFAEIRWRYAVLHQALGFIETMMEKKAPHKKLIQAAKLAMKEVG